MNVDNPAEARAKHANTSLAYHKLPLVQPQAIAINKVYRTLEVVPRPAALASTLHVFVVGME